MTLPSTRELRRSWGPIASAWLLASLLSSSASAFVAPPQRLQTSQYSERNGLSDPRLTDVAQGPDGRIWFAARSGIFLFDSVDWEVFRAGEELPENFIPERLAQGSDGRMWVLPNQHDEPLASFADGLWSFHPSPTPTLDVRAGRGFEVVPGPDGSDVVIVASTRHVWAWNGEAWQPFERTPDWQASVIHSIRAALGEVFIGSERGLERLALESRQLEPWLQLREGEGPIVGIDADPATERLCVLTQDWIGSVWEGELERIPWIDGPLPVGTAHSSSILHGDRGEIFLGTTLDLWLFDQNLSELRMLGQAEGLISRGVSRMRRDRDGNVWVANLRGATRIPPQQFEGYDSGQGLLDDEVSAITEVDHDAFLLGHQGGLSLLEDGNVAATFSFPEKSHSKARNERVLDLCSDGEGGAWIAAGNLGLGHWSRQEGLSWVASEAPIYCSSVLARPGAGLLVGSNSGFWDLQGTVLRRKETSIGQQRIRKLFHFEGGETFAALITGGLLAEREGVWEFVHPPERTLSSDVFSVLVTRTGRVERPGRTLVGTSSGLCEIHGRAFDVVPGDEGLDGPIYAMLEDSAGKIWFGTGRGLECWDGRELHSYHESTGLLGNEVNRSGLIEDSQRRIWVGTSGGLSRFLGPAESESHETTIELLGVAVGGQPVDLEHAQGLERFSDIEFRLRSVCFGEPGVARFRARLAGFDDEWLPERPITRNVLRYTNLPPGDYRLDLQARSPHGDWGPVVSSPEFRVRKPMWQLGWVRALFAVGLLALGFLLASLVTSRRRSASLEVKIQESSDALDESERRYREMFEKNPAIQLLVDPESALVLEANAAAASYFGNAADELRDQYLSDLIGLDEGEVRAGLSHLEGGGEWIVRPAEIDPVFGPPIEFRACLYPLSGRQVVQATIYDIEARQRLEQQLLEAHKLRAVGELATGVAHDFNNFLTAILGTNEVIAGECAEDLRIQEHVGCIREAGERGSALVKKLLAFGRKQNAAYEILELNELLQELASILRSALGSRIELELVLDDSVEQVHADRHQLERAMITLALAARESLPGGGRLVVESRLAEVATLEEQFREHDPETTYVELLWVVEGRAPGHELQAVKELARPGLAAVREILSSLGGETAVEAPNGGGFRVHLFLPQIETEVTLVPAVPPEPVDEGDQTVLLVEDDDIVRRTIASLLSGTGHRVLEAATLAAAHEAFEEASNRVDVVLTDLRLPDGDGRLLGERLRSARPDLPMIFMSGYYDEATRNDFEVFLMKPFSLDKLNQALRQVQEQ